VDALNKTARIANEIPHRDAPGSLPDPGQCPNLSPDFKVYIGTEQSSYLFWVCPFAYSSQKLPCEV
jgi:hypothetical protein